MPTSLTPSESVPLVSCIMPTANRHRYVPLAIEAFRRQDHPNRELLVLDDGTDAVADLVPDDDRIRYVRLDGRHSVGAKRNRAVELAQGDWIAHWDDDDWTAPWRLRVQLDALVASGRPVCGLSQLLFCNPDAKQAWLYRYPRNARPWVAGGTLVYHRDVWTRHPFEDVRDGEDTRFVWSLPGGSIHVVDALEMYVARVHGGNTSPKHTHSARWSSHSIADVRATLGDDWDAFAGAATPPTGSSGDGVAGSSHRGPVVHVRSDASRDPNASGNPNASDNSDASDVHPRVTVTIPYYRCKARIRRAVTSILGQTYPHLRLVVVNDGDPDPPWSVLDDVDDPRLVRFDLDANRGRYFADAVVVRATPDPFYLVQDADDWSAPDRLATLLARLRGSDDLGAISAAETWQGTHRAPSHGRPLRRLTYEALRRPLPPSFGFRSDHHGLFRTNALRAVGGYYGGFRIGYDTLLVNLLMMLGSVGYVEEPLYHRLIRPNSLTTSPTTGMRSARRSQVHTRLQALYDDAYARYRAAGSDDDARDGLADALARIATRNVSPEAERALATEARRLRDRLSGGRAAPTDLPALRALIHHPDLAWSREWAPMLETAHALVDALVRRRPRRILEAGSGNTTALFACYAQLTGAEVVTLEHDAGHCRSTRQLLGRLGLDGAVDLRHASLRSHAGGVWYGSGLEGPFDFVFLDGPPKRHGREASLPAVVDVVAPEAVVWLHDGKRSHERACVDAWTADLGWTAHLDTDGKGVWTLTGPAVSEAPSP